ncbi:RNA binding motif protein [Anopheles darlingi]|uniref:RNA binding motif protein n=1 Tax=Anopheles darlingi TaxID=43151 RepID=W5J9R8_ANODA|nr:RNA binding motif protein [Anopheles darlingi]
MSRIIVKNLPNGFDEAKVQSHFSTCGIITDVQLKYTPEGKFRNFGFIGFENEEQAAKAIKHFNNTFIRTSKISVAPCVALGETKNLKIWSKHAQKPVPGSDENGSKSADENDNTESSAGKGEKPKAPTAKTILERHQNDPKFQEFLEAHKRAGKLVWDNQFQQSEAESTTKTPSVPASSGDESTGGKFEKSTGKKVKSAEPKKPAITLFVAKVRNLPATTKRQDMLRFFKTAKPYSVRIPPKNKGFAYVGFKTEIELEKALLMDKSFLGGKQVRIVNFTDQNNRAASGEDKNGERRAKQAKWERQRANVPSESICESGKLFFRNLAYSVKEQDLREIFEKYGPVVEVDVPIDSNTRKLKGFGTVTFLMPEHAVMAYSELNGTFLQGRMFHILPAKVDEDMKEGENGDSNFKRKKEQTQKKQAQSSHNWNTLFMGENAVAVAMAKKYGTSKDAILMSTEGSTSAAVRLALGETEVVLEMQSFLQDNGIQLNAFDAPNPKRSSTLILVKNLAPNCTKEALREMFEKFGILGRVVLPPSGVTAIVEFLDPSEARRAFKKLAYTNFQSQPLYLEWAPENTFKSPTAPDDVKEVKEESNGNSTVKESPDEETVRAAAGTNVPKKEEEPLEDDTEPEEGTTLFIKNLSFKTVEATIQERFRKVGPIHSVQIVRTKNLVSGGPTESRGYGFIQFKHRKSADHALKNLQLVQIDGRPIELARSDRVLKTAADETRKSKAGPKQTGSKILVRNIPFQANASEIRDLFKPFGDIKVLRLPRKMVANADESHRGFGFVEFVREPDAKRAFETLGRSTHLYGRRLVLEWAAPDDGVEELRKRTAQQFGQSSTAAKRNRKGVQDAAEFVSSAADQRQQQHGDDEDDDGGDGSGEERGAF